MSFERTAQCCPLFGMCDFEEMFMKILNPNLVVYCSPAEGREQYESTAILYHQQFTSKFGEY